jgi:hypothetical protein
MNVPALLVHPLEFEFLARKDRLTTGLEKSTDSSLQTFGNGHVLKWGTFIAAAKKLGIYTKENRVYSDLHFGGWQPSRASKEKGEAWENSPRSKDAAHNETPTRGDSRIGVSYGNQY